VPDEIVVVRVDCRAVLPRKIEAIKRHRTQLAEFTALPDDLQRPYLEQECFVQAWPPVESGATVLGDLFAGLDSSG
jgi:LmbE family N-acetylglucosaminyl deacetylase